MANILEEEVILLPADVVQSSVGFSMDSGCSVTKLVFRSKQDYKNGQCLNKDIPEDKGIVRMAKFKSTEVDAIVDYLVDNCDVTTGCDDRKVHVTGMNITYFEAKFLDKLGLKVKCMVEYDMFIKAFHYLFSNLPRYSLVHSIPHEDTVQAEEYLKPYMEYNETHSEYSDCGFGSPDKKVKEDENLETVDVVPCLMTQMGSALLAYKINSDWAGDMVDFSVMGGRAFLGVANSICGECESFDEISRLASCGQTRNVDQHVGDIQAQEGDGMYANISNDMMCFAFGKISFSDPGRPISQFLIKLTLSVLIMSIYNCNYLLLHLPLHYFAHHRRVHMLSC